MKAIDTNVLVRFLVQDDEKQAQIATQLLAEAETNKQPLFVSNVVVLELMWVLRSAYEVPRDEILGSLNELLSMNDGVGVSRFRDCPRFCHQRLW